MAAGLDQAILEWWDSTEALATAVPTSRVADEIRQTNEDIADDEDDTAHFDTCVTYEIVTDPLWRTNSGIGYQSEVIFSCYSESGDEAKSVAQKTVSAFERQAFVGSECRVTLSRMMGSMELEQDDDTGLWTSSVTFSMNHTTV